MGTLGKVLLVGGVGVGAYLLLTRSASASSGSPSVPAGWQPPPGAIVVNLAPSATPVGVPLTLASWPAAAGQPAGNYVVIWNTTEPGTFVALFYSKNASGVVSSTPAVMQMGTTADSKTILAKIAEISTAVQQKNLAA